MLDYITEFDSNVVTFLSMYVYLAYRILNTDKKIKSYVL